MRLATKTINLGYEADSDYKAIVPPLYQSATFVWDSLDDIPKFDYTRVHNPNREMLEQVIAALEDAKHCTVFGSGMSAIVGAFSMMQAGDHMLMANEIYGGTFRVAEKLLPRQGITVSEFCASNPMSIHDVVKPNTKMLIFESPTNPICRVMDIEAIVREAKKHNLIVVFDNTFASPCVQAPLEMGVDIVVHSTTKYISGHSDIIGGATCTNSDEIGAAMAEYIKVVGAVPSPFDCWLTIRGVKTLDIRMKQHCENAQAIAEFLQDHPKVKQVHYPGLPEHPDHQLAKKQMRQFGGMIAFDLDTDEAGARRVAEGTKLFKLAESLGGVKSIIAFPPLMSHATMNLEQRLARGITQSMLRISVGIEDKEDLIDDLKQALDLI